MDRDFKIERGNDGLLKQEFNGKIYRLYKGERYFSRGCKRMHVAVWEFFNGKVPKGFHIHHKDNNPHNNEVENLELLEGSFHISKHTKERIQTNKTWFNEFVSKGIESAKAWHSSPEGIQWHKEHAAKFNFGSKTFGQFNCKSCNTTFEKQNFDHQFCSNKCKSKHRRANGCDDVKKICPSCQKEYTVNKYSRGKTCSLKCNWSLRKRGV